MYREEDGDEASDGNHGSDDRGTTVECSKKQNGEGQDERRYAVMDNE